MRAYHILLVTAFTYTTLDQFDTVPAYIRYFLLYHTEPYRYRILHQAKCGISIVSVVCTVTSKYIIAVL